MHVPFQPHADIGEMHCVHRAVHHRQFGHGLFARLDTVKQVPHVIKKSARPNDIMADPSSRYESLK